MASEELKKYVADVENIISAYGPTAEYIDCLVQASNVAIKTEKDVAYGLFIAERAKDLIEQIIEKQTGVDVWEFEKYCSENKVQYEILNKYYDVLKKKTFSLVLKRIFVILLF